MFPQKHLFCVDTLGYEGDFLVFHVSPERMRFGSGDLAGSLDASALQKGFCRTPAWIAGQLVLVNAGTSRGIDDGYTALKCVILAPIQRYEGPVYTYNQASSMRAASDIGVLLETSSGEYVVCATAEIMPGFRQ